MTDDRPRVGVIHATPAAMGPVRAAFAADLPGVVALNFLDEGLLDGLNQAGGTRTPALVRRLVNLLAAAETAGVRLILTTCSAYSPVMDTMRGLIGVPIVTIDEVLFEEAVAAATRLGVVATGEASLRTAGQALHAEAERRDRPLEIVSAAEPAAFAAGLAGDFATHDSLVAAAARRVAAEGVGAVMLAQESLSRALPSIGDLGVPLLTSPTLAVGRVARLLNVASNEQ